MGKKTLYHPVSLHVLRGAVEYCGFKFGKLKQTSSDPTGLTATYVAELEKLPKRCRDVSLYIIRAELQNCFNADIKVLDVRGNSHGSTWATIRASIVSDPHNLPLPETDPAEFA